MIHYGKHEILFLDTCFLYLYFPTDWIGQYLGTYHNNGAHISIVVSHNFWTYMDTLLTWPCLQRYCKYYNHEVVQDYHRFQIYDLIFHQTFCFEHCDFYIWGVLDDDCAILTGNDAWFWQICNTCTRTLPFIGESYYLVGMVKIYVRLNHWWWYYCLYLSPLWFHPLLLDSSWYHVFLWPMSEITLLLLTVVPLDCQ